MTPIAERYITEAKEGNTDEPAVAFMIITSSEGIGKRLRSMMSMPTLPPSQHEHPLKEMASDLRGWGCDGCGKDGGTVGTRFRCTQDCDFDFCGECNANAGKATEPQPMCLALLDIPDKGGYYLGPEGTATGVTLEKFVKDYQEKALERSQLG